MKNILRGMKQCIFILITILILFTACNSDKNDSSEEKKSIQPTATENISKKLNTVSPTKNTVSNKAEKKDDNLSGTWPNTELTQDIPKPKDGLVKTVQSEEDKCAIYVTMTFSQCKIYLQDIIDNGFSYESNSYDKFINNKGGDIQFGRDDGKAFKISYTTGLLKIMIFGY